jgi:hypothetical protein
VGCTVHHDPENSPCPGPQPAFRLEVRRASGEALPGDTSVEVIFDGSGQETFSLAAPAASLQVTFCGVVPAGAEPDAGAIDAGDSNDTAGVRSIRCDLWTNGAAKVTVKASGLRTESRELEAHTNTCGVVTTPSEIALALPSLDGGL